MSRVSRLDQGAAPARNQVIERDSADFLVGFGSFVIVCLITTIIVLAILLARG